jgi:hypothetical protein
MQTGGQRKGMGRLNDHLQTNILTSTQMSSVELLATAEEEGTMVAEVIAGQSAIHYII